MLRLSHGEQIKAFIQRNVFLSGVWGSQLLFYRFFLTFLFCNGIAKITRQEENILFISTTVYPFNPLKKHLFSLLCKAD